MRLKLSTLGVVVFCLAFALALPIASAQEAPTEGLVGHWQFDGTLVDAASGASGNPSGNPTFVDGLFGQALRLDGFSDSVNLGTNSAWHAENITISFWLNRFSIISGDRILVWAKDGTSWNGPGWFLNTNGNQIGLMVDGYSYFYLPGDPNTFFPADEWVHVAITFDSGNAQYAIYRNGVAQDGITLEGTTLPTSISTNAGPVLLGINGFGGAHFPGIIDDLRIYNRVLSESEIRALSQ